MYIQSSILTVDVLAGHETQKQKAMTTSSLLLELVPILIEFAIEWFGGRVIKGVDAL